MSFVGDMNIKLRSVSLYAFAEQYLKEHLPEGIDEAGLEKYFVSQEHNLDSINSIFERFVRSTQNYQRMPKVIKFDERRDEISRILNGFTPANVAQYNVDELYATFRKQFNITSKESPQNSWYKWSKSIVDSARLLREFKSTDDFRAFVDSFSYNAATRAALPFYLSGKISGMGFALACDALKELGYEYYPKPDVHMIEILANLEITEADPLSVYEELIRIADDNGITPYKLDKVLWLICSGNYYLDEGIKAPSYKKEFIEQAKEHLNFLSSVEHRITGDIIAIYSHEQEADDSYSREFTKRFMEERLHQINWMTKVPIVIYPPENDVIIERVDRMKRMIDRQRKLESEETKPLHD